MDRREFFKAGLKKASRSLVNAADNHARRCALHWIRPPYALDELEFQALPEKTFTKPKA